MVKRRVDSGGSGKETEGIQATSERPAVLCLVGCSHFFLLWPRYQPRSCVAVVVVRARGIGYSSNGIVMASC